MIWDGDYPPGSYGAEMQKLERIVAQLPIGDPQRGELMDQLLGAHEAMYGNLTKVAEFITAHGAEAFLRGEFRAD